MNTPPATPTGAELPRTLRVGRPRSNTHLRAPSAGSSPNTRPSLLRTTTRLAPTKGIASTSDVTRTDHRFAPVAASNAITSPLRPPTTTIPLPTPGLLLRPASIVSRFQNLYLLAVVGTATALATQASLPLAASSASSSPRSFTTYTRPPSTVGCRRSQRRPSPSPTPFDHRCFTPIGAPSF